MLYNQQNIAILSVDRIEKKIVVNVYKHFLVQVRGNNIQCHIVRSFSYSYRDEYFILNDDL